MAVETADTEFAGVAWTSLVTLHLRALDARSPRPVLGDGVAAEDEERLARNPRIAADLSSWRMRLTGGDRDLVVLRAAVLDAWTREHLAHHPDTTVLHLGCGLDGRAFRMHRPAATRWFDVDQPEVVDARRVLHPEEPGYRTIAAADIGDVGWLDEVTPGGHVLVVAEGLSMYLDEEAVGRVLRSVGHRFETGTVCFDVVAPWVVAVSRHVPPAYRGFRMAWAPRSPRDVTSLEPRLRLRDARSLVDLHADVPQPYRAIYRAVSRTTAGRGAMRCLRFELTAR